MPSPSNIIVRSVRRDGKPSWHVTLHRSGRRFHLHFADDTFGGEGPALAVAQAWRDAVLAAVPPLAQPGAGAVRSRQNGQSLPGLYRREPRGNRKAAWMARVAPPGGRARTCSFSIARHGGQEGKRLAEAWLQDEIAKVEAIPVPAPVPAEHLAPPRDGDAGPDEDPSYGIVRVSDAKGRSLWHVTVLRSARRVQSGFADLTYGGEAPALAVARAWRNAVMAVVPPLTNIAMRQIKRRNRRDGMPGVYHSERQGVWSAIVTLPGRVTVKRSFKVSVHGERDDYDTLQTCFCVLVERRGWPDQVRP